MMRARTVLSLSTLPLATAAASLIVGAGCSSDPVAPGPGLYDASSDQAAPGPGLYDAAGSSGNSGSSGSTSGSASGSTSGSVSGSTSGLGGPDAAADASGCCPFGWQSYSCTYPDGGEGTACHNPVLGCASSLTCGVGCDPVATGSCAGATDAGPSLRWWSTCGYPVCAAPAAGEADGGAQNDAGPGCPPIGSGCSTEGETCGTKSAANCGVIQQCSASDPTKGLGGCPMSSRKFKSNIHYVDDAQLEMLHDEAVHIRLATYNYKSQFDDPNPRHLGFIIEDDPQSPAVERTSDRVDMYGYLSLVVATMQVQEKEIGQLRRELDEARAGVCGGPHAQ